MKKFNLSNTAEYYNQQYNARAMIPDHPYIFTRWIKDSAHVRRTTAGLFNLPYGDSDSERLDFFPTNQSDAPLMVFIHGGWWRSLDKSDFSFIAPAYTRKGINVALTNYSLAPNASIEEIVIQQLRALTWLYRHAETYQFDRERIVLAGHSAGAHLTAMLMTAIWPAFANDLPLNLIKAGILLSGVYDLIPIQAATFVNTDLQLNEARAALLSPAFMPQACALPFITAAGGLESDEFKRQNTLIGEAWQSNHTQDILLLQENHLTICDAFATPGHKLYETALAQILEIV